MSQTPFPTETLRTGRAVACVVFASNPNGPAFYAPDAPRALRLESGDPWTEHPGAAWSVDASDYEQVWALLVLALRNHPDCGPVVAIDAGDFDTIYATGEERGEVYALEFRPLEEGR